MFWWGPLGPRAPKVVVGFDGKTHLESRCCAGLIYTLVFLHGVQQRPVLHHRTGSAQGQHRVSTGSAQPHGADCAPVQQFQNNATGSASPHKRGARISSHNFISFNNIANILRYLYEKPPHNSRKCG